MMGRGNTGPVYPWFGQDIRNGIPLAYEHYALLHRLWREDVVDWEGKFADAADRLHLGAAAARRRAAVRLARLDPQPRDRRAGRLLRRRLLPQQHLLAGRPRPADGRPVPAALRALRPRPGRPAIVGLGGQVFMRQNSQDAIASSGRTSTTPRSTAAARRSRTTWPRRR
jgi:alkanesulfonate monooxygenase SsuD/methylene tetrahydromethanopterin reductase-like flavin-dependent oxidoreductase (luciferase family)